ncbi:MAG: hybrid sensor histidine kinase/response regulator [Comamonas sp.]|nr:hybrid sensor histidine kinase/response regulator [Comamonas sp.]
MTKKTTIKCLIVDDIPKNLVALEALLKNESVVFLKAHSGNEALELLLANNDIALALLDVQMPEMNGFELAEYIRGSEKTRHIPLIFITAGSNEENWQFKGYESGAVDFLYKPINPHILASKVNIFFDLHRQRQEISRQLEERTEALRINDMFMAVLSHDLRNPLQIIKNSATLLKRQLPDPKALDCSERILKSSQRMAHMIEELLDVTRIRQSGGLRINTQELNLNSFLREKIEEIKKFHPSSIFSFREEENAIGYWDAEKLHQVFNNLLGNAIQHGEKECPIEVTINSDRNNIYISIKNSGEIPAEKLKNIFTPFRGEEARSGLEGGLGLGLYIAQQIIKTHQGEITVNSRDHFTEFNIILPKQTKIEDIKNIY